MNARLTGLAGLAPSVELPSYDRNLLTSGILHIGPGAFFRAHFAPFTDAALGAGSLDWGIEAASLRTASIADNLTGQNGLYTLLVRQPDRTVARVIGSIIKAHVAPRDPLGLLARLADPAIKIVSLTVTEKAYGLDAGTGGLDVGHSDVASDLADRYNPNGVVGYIVEGLRLRKFHGVVPFTPLSCDNLPNNGGTLKRLVLDFAGLVDAPLRDWIDAHVPFPSTMVDRITPASTAATYADAEQLTGRSDLVAVETEPFAQWVIEDRFVNGRPAWELVGVSMVESVSAHEKMKLRMLNGTHSLLAYLGSINGYEFIRDVMEDQMLINLARKHLGAAAETLDDVPGVQLEQYADDLIARFTNKAIAHRTQQIASDGTGKLPQRWFEPAVEALAKGSPAETYAIGVAAWIRYWLGVDRQGKVYQPHDPKAADIGHIISTVSHDAESLTNAFFGLVGLFPEALTTNERWRSEIIKHLSEFLKNS